MTLSTQVRFRMCPKVFEIYVVYFPSAVKYLSMLRRACVEIRSRRPSKLRAQLFFTFVYVCNQTQPCKLCSSLFCIVWSNPLHAKLISSQPYNTIPTIQMMNESIR